MSICATIKASVTITTRTGVVQTQIASPWVIFTWLKNERSSTCAILHPHDHNCLCVGGNDQYVLLTAWVPSITWLRLNHSPPLETSRRADKLWFASKLIFAPSFHEKSPALQSCRDAVWFPAADLIPFFDSLSLLLHTGYWVNSNADWFCRDGLGINNNVSLVKSLKWGFRVPFSKGQSRQF